MLLPDNDLEIKLSGPVSDGDIRKVHSKRNPQRSKVVDHFDLQIYQPLHIHTINSDGSGISACSSYIY